MRGRKIATAAVIGLTLSGVHALVIGLGSAAHWKATRVAVDGLTIEFAEGWCSTWLLWPDVPPQRRGTLTGKAAWWSVGPTDRNGSGVFVEMAFGFPFAAVRKGCHEFGGLETGIRLRDQIGAYEFFPGSSMFGIPTGVLWSGAAANAVIWAFVFVGASALAINHRAIVRR